MKTRRIAIAILCLITVLALLPTAALAADPPVAIGGVDLDTGEYYVNGANGTPGTVFSAEPASWNSHYYIDNTTDPLLSTPTLELNGLVLTDYRGQVGIYVEDSPSYINLVLALSGDSRVSISYDSESNPAGLYVDIPLLMVKGSGSLDAASYNGGYGVYASSFIMQSGRLSGAGGDIGIDCTGTFKTSGGEVTAVGHKAAALHANSAIISDGSVVAGGGTGIAPKAGIRTEFTCAISGGKVEARGRDYGIQASSGENITISGGKVLATGGNQALNATGSVDLSGYPAPHVITVSTNESGSPEATYAESDIATYKYFHIGPVPVTVDGLPMTATATQSSYYVNNTDDNQGTVYTTEPSSWNAKLELVGGEYKLTIKDLEIERGNSNSGIKSNVDLNLHLGVGTTRSNTIIIRTGTEPAVDVTGDLLITSENTDKGLDAYSHVGSGINVTGDLTVNNNIHTPISVYTHQAGCAGVHVGGDLLVETGSRGFEAFAERPNSDSRGVKVGGNVVMNGDKLRGSVFANGGAPVGISLEAGGSIALNNGFIQLCGGVQAVNKQPDLSAHPAYIYSTDNRLSFHHMPYTYSSAHTDLAIDNAPIATITDVTVSGTPNAAIAQGYEAIIVTEDFFNSNMAANTDVSDWFTNRPVGLIATLKAAVAQWGTFAIIAFSGTPTAGSTAAMAVTIPADKLSVGLDLTVTANADAKWAITSPTPPVITSPTANRTVSVTVGSPATLSVTATGATGYQWWLNRGSGFEIIPDATNASYTTPPVTLANNGYQYYCVVTGNGGSVTSPIFTLNVIGPINVPVTGDSFMPGLWLGVMLLSGAGLAAARFTRRRRRAE